MRCLYARMALFYIISVFQIKVNIFISDMAYLHWVMNVIFERIRNLREDNDLKQRQLAEYLNVSQNTYSQYETGTIALSAENAVKLAAFYKVSVDYLLGVSDSKQPYGQKNKYV